MTTKVLFNGSKWSGEEPDELEALFVRLASHPLDPRFEHYGDFAERLRSCPEFAEHHGIDPASGMHFSGNFLDVSAAFGVVTDDEGTIARLMSAIRANKDRDDYRAARPEVLADCRCPSCWTPERAAAIARGKRTR